jgi:hypothetical protein
LCTVPLEFAEARNPGVRLPQRGAFLRHRLHFRVPLAPRRLFPDRNPMRSHFVYHYVRSLSRKNLICNSQLRRVARSGLCSDSYPMNKPVYFKTIEIVGRVVNPRVQPYKCTFHAVVLTHQYTHQLLCICPHQRQFHIVFNRD